MTRHLHIVSPVATQENRCVVDLRPNLNDQLVEAEWVQKEVGRHSRLSSLRDRAAARLAGSRFNPGRIIAGDLFFLITGAMVALDLVLVIWLSQR